MKRIVTANLILTLILLTSITSLMAQEVNDVQLYTFAHSLIDHRPPAVATPSDETTILHWIHDISLSSGKTFASGGQFGQLANHVDGLPPNSILGYDNVPGSWDEDTHTFANSGINTILLTAANFIQYSPPAEADPSDPSGRTVIALTETIFDWTDNEIPNMRYYIYGNWPEMNLQQEYPPNLPMQSEVDDFHDVTIGTTGGFHQWWVDYQDLLVASRPGLSSRLIPAGMIISKILRDVIPDQIPFDELYEDSAPHGRANIYFLAGMVTYMSLYEQNIPEDYMPSDIVSSVIRNNLATIRDFAWQELNDFNFENGDSRVFYGNTKVDLERVTSIDRNINIVPNPVADNFNIEYNSSERFSLNIYDINGTLVKTVNDINNARQIDIKDLASGVYFLKLSNINSGQVLIKKLVKL